MGTIWHILQFIKSSIGNGYRSRTLFIVIRNILITSQSVAVYRDSITSSLLTFKKNKRKGTERKRLDIDGTLSSILVVKLDKPESEKPCYKYKPDEELMGAVKKATHNCKVTHSSQKLQLRRIAYFIYDKLLKMW